MSEKQKRPNTPRILEGLKDFQQETVEYVYRRLYEDDDAVSRFLIADEVGLGKTLVARGVVAKAVDRLWDDVDRIDIVYVCANRDIARQNINRLNITGEPDVAVATRMTLLPLYLHNLQDRKLNFVSFTPRTSFDLRSQGGIAYERALIYHILRRGWGFGNIAGPASLKRSIWKPSRNSRTFDVASKPLSSDFPTFESPETFQSRTIGSGWR
jgi:hypothetical protein